MDLSVGRNDREQKVGFHLAAVGGEAPAVRYGIIVTLSPPPLPFGARE